MTEYPMTHTFPLELVDAIFMACWPGDWENMSDSERPLHRAHMLSILSEFERQMGVIAALKDARPYVASQAHFSEDKRAQAVCLDIDAALAKAGAK